MTYPTREDVARPRRRWLWLALLAATAAKPAAKKRPKSVQRSAMLRADEVFSKIVRGRVGFCEACGRSGDVVQLQCAHWIQRTKQNIRTDFDNAFCLCAGCHFAMTDNPTRWSDWCIERRGRATYERLNEAGNEASKMYWPDELLRLREIAKREGIAV